MTNWNAVDSCIQNNSLLKHPFYQAWSEGHLKLSDLQFYASQYYILEGIFPRLLSRIHSSCDNPIVRQSILENLIDEERGAENHLELWMRFAEGLGLNREEVISASPHKHTERCIQTLMSMAAQPNPAVGLAALYAYESQSPEISRVKILGLKSFYSIENERPLHFFEVHEKVDIWHAKQEKEMIESLGGLSNELYSVVDETCQSLHCFLDGVDQSTRLLRH